ncbi:hypothetical protein GH714_006695 [Hevea brasiliensis]|uniref:Agamous-like MADS-box protein AGL80 n=1 Tax=Hevea brasiliensis TaxID=3981 RepID=A0A6A6NG94_HEVBR|nr:hypothetical protein GH714_006695 [Hevea brasiliensis]
MADESTATCIDILLAILLPPLGVFLKLSFGSVWSLPFSGTFPGLYMQSMPSPSDDLHLHPYDSLPEVWPSPLGVQRVLAQFKNMPEMDQSKKMVNQDSFLRQRIAKANEQLKKQRKDNREKEMTQIMFQGLIGKSLNSLNMMDLNDLGWLIDQNLRDIHKRIETLNKQANSQAGVGAASSSGAGPSGEVNIATEQAERQTFGIDMDAVHRQQWLMDWKPT